MFLAGSSQIELTLAQLVLHEDEVPELEEALDVVAGQIVRRAEVEPAVEIELAARTARAGRTCLPEVVLAAEAHDLRVRHAHRLPVLDRVLVRAETELVVAAEDRHPDLFGLEAEAVDRQVVAEADRLFLEVVAEAEVAEHLEHRQVAGRLADLVDVGRAEALLAAGQARCAAASPDRGSTA